MTLCCPVEFILFALTLLGVAVFHRHTLLVALCGLGLITLYKLTVTGFAAGPGLPGLAQHLGHEWVLLANLLGLLLGFALLARHFEDSHLPQLLPRFLPVGWLGGFTLLAIIFLLSSFLDNIAAALIGGTMALIAAITRKAFTNEALLDRLDRELVADRDRIDRQRSEDRKADGDLLDRIETDIRSMRDMLFDAFQRGRSD